MILVLCVWSLRKSELWFFSVKCSVKIYINLLFGYDVVLILLVSEMLKIPKAKAGAHFLKKLDFVTNNNNIQTTALQLSQYSYVHKFSYYLVYSTKLSQ